MSAAAAAAQPFIPVAAHWESVRRLLLCSQLLSRCARPASAHSSILTCLPVPPTCPSGPPSFRLPARPIPAEGSSFGDECKDDTYSANVAMLYYEDGDKPYFYFLRDLFKESKF